MTRVIPAVFLVDVDDTPPENDRMQDLAASQRCRTERPNNIHLPSMSWYLMHYPFANRLYRRALDVLERFRAWGPTTGILSDGDIVFRPRKVARSGISEATGGPCVFYIRKEEAQDDVQQRYPADYRVRVDDKLRLTAMKKAWGEHGTAVFPVPRKIRARPGVASFESPARRYRREHRRLARVRPAGLLAAQRSIPSTTEVTR